MQFPLSFPYIFGLVEAAATLPATAVSSAALADGVATSAPVTAEGSADVNGGFVIEASLSISAAGDSGAAFVVRAVPTVSVSITADVVLASSLAADLGVQAEPVNAGGDGADTGLLVGVDGTAGSSGWFVTDSALAVTAEGGAAAGDGFDTDLAVTVDVDAVTGLGQDVAADTSVAVNPSAVVRGDPAADTDLPVTVDTSGAVGDGLATVTAVAADADAESLAQLVIDADLAVAAAGEAAGGYGVRGTPTVSVTATADTRLDGVLAADLSGVVTDDSVLGEGTGCVTPVTNYRTAQVSVGSGISAELAVAVSAPVAGSHGLTGATVLFGLVGTSGGVSAGRRSESLLGAVSAASGAIRRTIPIAGGVQVVASVTAAAIHGEGIAAVLPVTVDSGGEQRKTRPVAAATSIVATPLADAALDSEYVGQLDVVVTIEADLALQTSIDAEPLGVTVTLTARSQVGGTTADRIITIDGDVRVRPVEPRVAGMVVPADLRGLAVPPRTALPVDGGGRTVRVEQRI